MILFAFQAIFVLCISYTIVSDFRTLRIPNWIIIILVCSFAVFAAIHLDLRTTLGHVALALAMLVLASLFFIANWVAGGDVKLLAATTLWIGPEHATYFTILMALIGSVLAMVLIGVRNYSSFIEAYLPDIWLVRRMATLAAQGQCPYGVAIGIAALLTPGSLFVRSIVM